MDANPPHWTAPFTRLWQSRALLFALVRRDLRGRYAGSSAGFLWAVIGPLFQITILTVVFSTILEVRFGAASARAPFAIVLAWGLFPWTAFSEALSRATTSLTDSGVLIKRMAFPPEVVLVQPALSAAIQEAVALGLVLCAMLVLSVPIAPTVVLCVLPLALQALLAVGIGWILGVLHVYLRDTAQVVVVALQAWFYLTPIVYPIEAAPAALRGLLTLNPLLGIVGTFRGLALGEPIPWGALAWAVVATALALGVGACAVTRARAEISDLV